MNNMMRFVIVLFLVNFAAASILAGMYNVTKSKIEARQKLVEENALKEVMPESVGTFLEPVKENGEIKYWEVFKNKNSKPAGYVFIAKKYGYSSVIETMVGIKKDGTITGVSVLSQNETPGLGAKIVEVVSDDTLLKALKQVFSKEKEVEAKILPYFTEQFKGLNVGRLELSKDGIHAITGATISSKAVLDSIKEKGLEILGK
jgi:Na+-translocating ferredoxin:NAD+ oxidoreductase subunit G